MDDRPKWNLAGGDLYFPWGLIGKAEFAEILLRTGLPCIVPVGERFGMLMTINYELRRSISTATALDLPAMTDPKMKRLAKAWAEVMAAANNAGTAGNFVLSPQTRKDVATGFQVIENSGGTRKRGRPTADRKREFFESLLGLFILIFGDKYPPAATNDGTACRFMQALSTVLLRRLNSAVGAKSDVFGQLHRLWSVPEDPEFHIDWSKTPSVKTSGGMRGARERARKRLEGEVLPLQQAMLSGAAPVFEGDIYGSKFAK